MPGVIMCGPGEGEGLGLAVLFAGVRLRVTVLFFLGAAFGLGFAAGLGMTCPSCWGNTLVVRANIKANALTVRSAIFKLLDRFMVPPYVVRQGRTLTGCRRTKSIKWKTQADARARITNVIVGGTRCGKYL